MAQIGDSGWQISRWLLCTIHLKGLMKLANHVNDGGKTAFFLSHVCKLTNYIAA
jgi:hypothetical protein